MIQRYLVSSNKGPASIVHFERLLAHQNCPGSHRYCTAKCHSQTFKLLCICLLSMGYAKYYSTSWKAIALSVVTLAGQHDASQYTLECLCAMNDSEVKTKLPNIKNSLEHMSTMSENERSVVISIALLEYNNQKRQADLEQKSMDLRAREEARSKHSGKLKLSAVANGVPSPIQLYSPGWVLVYSSWPASYWLKFGQTFSLWNNSIDFNLKTMQPYQACIWGA